MPNGANWTGRLSEREREGRQSAPLPPASEYKCSFSHLHQSAKLQSENEDRRNQQNYRRFSCRGVRVPRTLFISIQRSYDSIMFAVISLAACCFTRKPLVVLECALSQWHPKRRNIPDVLQSSFLLKIRNATCSASAHGSCGYRRLSSQFEYLISFGLASHGRVDKNTRFNTPVGTKNRLFSIYFKPRIRDRIAALHFLIDSMRIQTSNTLQARRRRGRIRS